MVTYDIAPRQYDLRVIWKNNTSVLHMRVFSFKDAALLLVTFKDYDDLRLINRETNTVGSGDLEEFVDEKWISWRRFDGSGFKEWMEENYAVVV